MSAPDFIEFPKMLRLSREIVVTEKIDGTNAQIHITEDGRILAGSRTRWITPESDNFGFSAWVHEHRDELMELGPGSHFGEWWGAGIQRRYDQTAKRFSLFNVSRWCERRPACCDVVPVIYTGNFCTLEIERALDYLRTYGSLAAPGYMRPEGVVVYHTAGRIWFKKTLERDETPKGMDA